MNKRLKATLVVLVVLCALALSFGVVQSADIRKKERQMNDVYGRAFYELIDHVDKISVALSKAALAGDSYQLMKLSSVIRESAAFATSDLSEVPLDTGALYQIAAFLNQAGDYTASIAVHHSDGTAPTEEETGAFIELSRYAKELSDALTQAEGDVASGKIAYLRTSENETVGDRLYTLERERFSDYEGMTYDGPFSEHMKTRTSSSLGTYPAVTERQASDAARACLYGNVPLAFSEETGGDIPCYAYAGDSDEAHYRVEISKQGGFLASMSCGRVFSDETLSLMEALTLAEAYVSAMGYAGMTPTYYETHTGALEVNFAFQDGDVTVYSDLIKVKVALDNGDIVGFEAEGYLMNHQTRSLKAALSEEEAASRVGGRFSVQGVQKAVIPTEYASERFCYELEGTFEDKTFLIYVNAETGVQEDILLLDEDEDHRLVR